MKYTTYFSEFAKQSGVPRVSHKQFKRMMNIIWLETQLSSMHYVKKDLTNTPFHRRYDLVIRSLDDRLSDLTKNLEPWKLMKEFGNLSKINLFAARADSTSPALK